MSEKKKERKACDYYEIRGETLTAKLRKCPRCGGFMAHHKEPIARWACGGCSYTEYITVEETKGRT